MEVKGFCRKAMPGSKMPFGILSMAGNLILGQFGWGFGEGRDEGGGIIDAHIQATYDEHVFLQAYIAQHYRQPFQVGTLLKVNREDDFETDFQLLLESDIGVVIVEDDKLAEAQQIIAELKGEPG
jgi:hypothetical protein